MNPELAPLKRLECYAAGLLRAHEVVNAAVWLRFDALRHDPELRRTHKLHGRYENIYIDFERIPELQPVVNGALVYAKQLLGRNSIKYGFWFNDMGPGSLTTLHTHEENDELLSGVYYVNAPAYSGRLIIHRRGTPLTIEPKPGMFVFFAPELPHEVGTNQSDQHRLSVAFNFGAG